MFIILIFINQMFKQIIKIKHSVFSRTSAIMYIKYLDFYFLIFFFKQNRSFDCNGVESDNMYTIILQS